MEIWWLVLQTMYFFLPAYFANMVPELLKWLPFLDYPIWEKEFGKNKTWRGIFFAVLVGTLTFLLQKWLYQFSFFNDLSIIDYAGFSLMLGLLLGLGAILGDLVESYFKRGVKIDPGQPWIPWDQLDFVLGALSLSLLIYVPKIEVVLVILIVSPLLHLLFCRIGYWLKIKEKRT
ncbi:MAG: CDP-archaeol synthase [Candidatus Woesearchaeota archaeon]